jgi:hypothetical protein
MSSIGDRKRCRRYDEPGHAHFLTFTCFRRQLFLSRDRTCQWLAEAIGSALDKHYFHLWAYVFMPEWCAGEDCWRSNSVWSQGFDQATSTDSRKPPRGIPSLHVSSKRGNMPPVNHLGRPFEKRSR